MEVDEPPKHYADLRREWQEEEELELMEVEQAHPFELPDYVDSDEKAREKLPNVLEQDEGQHVLEEPQIVLEQDEGQHVEEQLFAEPPQKRGRGRPRKNATQDTSGGQSRGRGRRRGQTLEQDPEPVPVPEQAPVRGRGRGRGRPATAPKKTTYTWVETAPVASECRQTNANIIREPAGVCPEYKFNSIVEGFKRFFTPQMINMVVHCSNIYIEINRLNIDRVTSNEIYAYIGVRIMMGAYNDSA